MLEAICSDAIRDLDGLADEAAEFCANERSELGPDAYAAGLVERLLQRAQTAEARATRFDEVGAYGALVEEMTRTREYHTRTLQRAAKNIRNETNRANAAEQRIADALKLMDGDWRADGYRHALERTEKP